LTFVGRIKLSHCFLLLKWINQRQCHLCFSFPLSLIHTNICVCVCVSFFISQTRFHLLSFLPINKTFCYIFPPNQALLAVLQNSTTFDSVLLRIQSLSYNLNVNSNPTRGHSYLTCFPVSSLFGLPFLLPVRILNVFRLLLLAGYLVRY
jgi:hypothetical protein